MGSEESNLTLSRGRAESVRDYLVQNGLKSDRVIAARGFGESKPVADNETPAGRQVNRRVEIIIAEGATSFIASPEPSPRKMRPGARQPSVAKACATTAGW